MTGTIANTGAIVAGTLVGLTLGKRLPERFKAIIMQAIGLAVILMGLQMAFTAKDILLVTGCLLAGGITGEGLKIEQRVESFGQWLKSRFKSSSSTFVQGFVSASLLYITGAMAIVGSIQDGTIGDPRTLYFKSLLDGISAIAFSATMGIGVIFSALSVFVVQGSITLLSSSLLFLQEPKILSAINSTGGIIIMGIGTNILEMTKIRIGNFIPALLYTILWAYFYN
ncbi:MAG: putative membrane protein YdfK [Syntrophus sp. PtaB.Bin001]|nr:MAG: putative membrane protein YdfK [Syntrophus sp. PtaB.Bin001]